eukprot:scaffold12871_cov76-Phaeocystis_antarctica.AAC.7
MAYNADATPSPSSQCSRSAGGHWGGRHRAVHHQTRLGCGAGRPALAEGGGGLLPARRARVRAAHVVEDPPELPTLHGRVRLALVALVTVVAARAAQMVDGVERGSGFGAGGAAWRARLRAAHVVVDPPELPTLHVCVRLALVALFAVVAARATKRGRSLGTGTAARRARVRAAHVVEVAGELPECRLRVVARVPAEG